VCIYYTCKDCSEHKSSFITRTCSCALISATSFDESDCCCFCCGCFSSCCCFPFFFFVLHWWGLQRNLPQAVTNLLWGDKSLIKALVPSVEGDELAASRACLFTTLYKTALSLPLLLHCSCCNLSLLLGKDKFTKICIKKMGNNNSSDGSKSSGSGGVIL
jgi:hypothetical protein